MLLFALYYLIPKGLRTGPLHTEDIATLYYIYGQRPGELHGKQVLLVTLRSWDVSLRLVSKFMPGGGHFGNGSGHAFGGSTTLDVENMMENGYIQWLLPHAVRSDFKISQCMLERTDIFRYTHIHICRYRLVNT